MPDHTDLTKIETHYAFGRNWASYAESIGEREIGEAVDELKKLVGASLEGKRFLDIGCGSGLHSLAALRLGASSVSSIDLDPYSVETTRAVLNRHAPNSAYDVRLASILDMSPADVGHFDFVYSWGVLHHTGDMYRALRKAADLVGSNGQFAFALYRKTWSCWLWRIEKRWYANASAKAQAAAERIYVALFSFALSVSGRRFAEYVRSYKPRGMDYYHDVKDWLGGYPYESIDVGEVDALMTQVGLKRQMVFSQPGQVFGKSIGLFGAGCDEFVYVRPA